ncbi:galactokinase [Mycobacterium ulcerans]|uniref:Galactokinase n=2 Tax=Mycobacterium ulcerans TaxID=1809 RepID=A0ABY3V8S6_MYCUL|nr:galactokinase [Mycobacterium ulcerans]UDM34158.1 galactokinase [Mycobacterium ulcerans]ULP51477.1 galactokinase [Mycobacterium ulcerans]
MTIRYAAPGRINLIGEHTDYNLGWALPIALPQRAVATLVPDHGDALTASSDLMDGAVRIPLDTVPGGVSGWAGYVAGVIWALRCAGHPVSGGAISISSDVEIGSGLSSSAALECAVLGAITSAAGVEIDRIEQARLAQRAENEYVGAPTGLLDQLAALFGAPATALLIDFRDLSVQAVQFYLDAHGVALLLIDSRARHRHAGGEYAARRASCERAAKALHAPSLRDVAELSSLTAIGDPIDARHARHVLTENRRVHEFVAALRDCDFTAAGRIFTASHASMRDDFEITTEHIDLIADAAVRAGALGARMTGGGFGGCVIALVVEAGVEAVIAAVHREVRGAGYPPPAISRAHAAAGAGPLRGNARS